MLRIDTIRPDTVYTYWVLGIKELPDNNFIVAAEKNNDTIPMGADFFKIDTIGNILWRVNISRDSIIIRDIIALNDTGFIIIGVRPFDNFQIFVKRFDSTGNLIGNYSYISTYTVNDRLHIKQTSDKGFIIGAEIGFGGTDLLILKTDSLGIQQWYRTFGSINFDDFGSVTETSDNGYIICGSKYVAGNNKDYYLIKTNSMGIVDSTFTAVFNYQASDLQIKIYPNPSTSGFSIKNISSKEKISIEIINVLGEIVYSEIYLGQSEYLLHANLRPNFYFVRVSDGEKNVVLKLLVE